LFTQLYGLETVTLRYFNVFGPRQNPNSQYAAVIPRFITACLKREPLFVYGDGQQSRDFTYEALLLESGRHLERPLRQHHHELYGAVVTASSA
jgi:hypothetical protein